MKRHGILLLFLLLGLHGVRAAAWSDSTVVSLVTCSPGPEVYARFGHTALRVRDPLGGVDLVFNYGVFDFSTNNFYVKFVKGETDYKLAVYDFRYFLPEYEERGSSVWEQRLNLNPQEKRRLIEALMVNYRPENRVYRYNFVFDNCSTRPRDKIEEAVDGQVRYGNGQPEARPLTFRQWIARYVGADTWLMLGIDMIFGLESDRPASLRQSMFLPEVLMRQVSDARIVADGAPERPLAQPAVTLVRGGSGPLLTDGCGWLKPLPVMWLLVVLVGLSTALARRRGGGWRLGLRVFDTGLFALAGLVGCVIFFLDFVSLHPLVGDNLNVLWLNPLLLLSAVGVWLPGLRRPRRVLGGVLLLCMAAACVLYVACGQSLNAAFVPLWMVLCLRVADAAFPAGGAG